MKRKVREYYSPKREYTGACFSENTYIEPVRSYENRETVNEYGEKVVKRLVVIERK